ncbi:MAG TPA: hypothetical protein VGE16_18100 [Albitalea sp.]
MKQTLTLWMSAAIFLASNGTGTAAAQTVLKDGMTCTDQVCLGDDILQLRHIPWHPVVHPATGEELAQARVSQATLDRVKLALRADEPDIEAVAPYWYLRAFDGSGLQALASLRAVCGVLGFADRLKAAYTGATGDLIEVRFEPVAAADGLTQAFRVVEIRRYADPRTPPQQLKQLGEHLAEQYADFSRYANSTQPGAGWIDDGRSPPHLRLLAPTGDVVDNAFRLRQHPECSAS